MNKIIQRVKDKGEKGAYSLEIYNKQNRGYIEVWLTNEEQQMYAETSATVIPSGTLPALIMLSATFGHKKTPCIAAGCQGV